MLRTTSSGRSSPDSASFVDEWRRRVGATPLHTAVEPCVRRRGGVVDEVRGGSRLPLPALLGLPGLRLLTLLALFVLEAALLARLLALRRCLLGRLLGCLLGRLLGHLLLGLLALLARGGLPRCDGVLGGLVGLLTARQELPRFGVSRLSLRLLSHLGPELLGVSAILHTLVCATTLLAGPSGLLAARLLLGGNVTLLLLGLLSGLLLGA